MSISKSEHIGQLVAALALAQTEFETVFKGRENTYTHSRYAELQDVIKATQPALSKNGLVIIQVPIRTEQEAGVSATLAHKSGEHFSVDLLLPATMRAKEGGTKFDAQSIGSAITYARRYTWQSLIGVAAENDDDGNAAAGNDTQSSSQSDQPRRVQKPPQVNQAPAKTGSKPSPKPAPEPPQNAQGSAQTGETKAEAPSVLPKAVIPVDPIPTESTPTATESTSSGQTEPDKKADISDKPNKTQFDAYTARAVALKQPLEKVGLKAGKGITTGGKIKNHLLASAEVKELADLTVTQWDAWLQLFEGLAKTDPAKAVQIIEGDGK